MRLLSEGLCRAAVAYAGVWESGAANAEVWPRLRKSVAARYQLTGRAYWVLDLYEERAFTAGEVRDAICRLEEAISDKGELQRVEEGLKELFSELELDWPASPLFRNWSALGESRLSERILRLFSRTTAERDFPTLTREADFEAFLRMEGFERGYIRFWRIPPKNRTNHLTRALVSIAAAIAFLGTFRNEDDLDALDQLLVEHYHATRQTVRDLVTLVRMFSGTVHDPAELACRLRSDASAMDMTSLVRLMDPIRQIGRKSGEEPVPLSDAENLFSNVVCEGLDLDS